MTTRDSLESIVYTEFYLGLRCREYIVDHLPPRMFQHHK